MGDPPRATETGIEILERLSGPMKVSGLAVDNKPVTAPVWAELTMRFNPIEIRKLVDSKGGAQLDLDSCRGHIRVFATMPDQDRDALDREALFVAPLSAKLKA